MRKSKNDVEKAHEATVSLQGIAAAMERERAKNGRADSDPRGEERGSSANRASAIRATTRS